MCLASAYIGSASEEPILREIARIKPNGDSVELQTLLGESKVVQGKIAEIDFMGSRVIIKQ